MYTHAGEGLFYIRDNHEDTKTKTVVIKFDSEYAANTINGISRGKHPTFNVHLTLISMMILQVNITVKKTRNCT